jgi:hypothetical protein
MLLKNTPFIVLKRHNLPSRNYAIGRTDTKEMLCIGSFGKDFCDCYDEGDKVFLRIKPDGSALEHWPTKILDDSEIVRNCEDGSVIVMANINSYWLVPHGFYEWAANVFKQTSENIPL